MFCIECDDAHYLDHSGWCKPLDATHFNEKCYATAPYVYWRGWDDFECLE